MRKKFIFASLLIIPTVLGTTCSAQAKNIKWTPELLKAYRTLIAVTQEADTRMYDQMKDTVEKLRDEFDAGDEFPTQGDLEEAVTRLNRSMSENPYRPMEKDEQDPSPTIGAQVVSPFDNPATKVAAPPPPVEKRIRIIIDGDMSPGKLEQMLDSGVDWTAEPGHIVVITNAYDYLAAWAAGSNLKPIIDEQGKPRMVIANFGHHQ